MQLLDDKVALITGSRRGIGLAIAKKFAQNKCKVVISATSQEGCEAIAKEISNEYGVETLGLKMDVSNFDEVQETVKKIIEKFGKIDILVNNAGITKDNFLIKMKLDEWTDVLDTNLNSIFNVAKACVPYMLKKRTGAIVNVSSAVGLSGNKCQSNYAAAKAGMLGFTKTLARELGAKGIRSNAVAPGFTETDMISDLADDYINNLINQQPIQRLGKPEEIADAVLFLASDLSSYITGQVLSVDGGMVMN